VLYGHAGCPTCWPPVRPRRVAGIGILVLLLGGCLLGLVRPALFASDATFAIGTSAVQVAAAVGAKPDYILGGPGEAEFWFKSSCTREARSAVSSVWVYQRLPRKTVALGIDAHGIVRCADFSWGLTFVHA